MATIEEMLDDLEWCEVASDKLIADEKNQPCLTHEAVLELSVLLRCYQLSDGSRVIDGNDVRAAFGDILDMASDETSG